ncbi:MAG: hypothetical protein RLZZ480_47 [Candidatus Parcubacteria bacterium]|jgi:hypothetical protein
MKPTKRLATKAEMTRNLTEARKLLGELRYYIFTPAESLNIRSGFVAINWFARSTLFPSLVVIRSRGSFLQVQAENPLFMDPLIRRLKKTLWVPIHIGQPLQFEEAKLKKFIHRDEHTEFDAFYPDARR